MKNRRSENKWIYKSTRVYWKHMLLGAVIGFLTTGSNIGLMMTSAFLLAKASFHPSIAELQVAIVGVRFFGIARGIFRYLERLITHETTFSLLAGFRKVFYRKLYQLVPNRISYFRFGDLVHRVTSDIESLQFLYLRVWHHQMVLLLTILLVFILFGTMGIVPGILIVIWMMGTALIFKWVSSLWIAPLQNETFELEQKLRYQTLDFSLGMPDLLLNDKWDDFSNQHSRSTHRVSDLKKKIRQREKVLQHAIGLSMNLLIVFLSSLIIVKSQYFHLSLIAYNVMIIGIMAAFEPLFAIPDAVRYQRGIRRSISRLSEIMEVPSKAKTASGQSKTPEKMVIEAENVTVYSPSGNILLKDFSFHIPERSFSALVGPTGVGKTTLSKILIGEYPDYKGNITIDKVSLQDISSEWLRQHIGYLEQNPYLFSATLRENLLLKQEEDKEKEIMEWFSRLKLDHLWQILPDGLDTWVGEYGVNFSGGEKRLLALIRILIRDPAMLILDEPTYGLDPERSYNLIQVLKSMSRNKTILVITHERKYLPEFDRVILMGNHGIEINKRG